MALDLWAVIALYIGGVIGAGFASGQELVVFFVRYGWGGLVGIFFATAVFIMGTYLILDFCAARNATSYLDFFSGFNPPTRILFDASYTFLLLVGTAVMFAGCAALAGSAHQRPLFRLGTAFLVYLTLCSGKKGVLKVGRALTPAIVIFLCLLAVKRLLTEGVQLPENGSWRGLEAALLYASYNLGFSMAVLAGVTEVVDTAQRRWAAALWGNLALGACMLLLFLGLGGILDLRVVQPLPLGALAAGEGRLVLVGYRAALWAAMFTTAAANSFAAAGRLVAERRLQWAPAGLIVVLASLALSYFGFTALIRVAYPLVGLAALWFLINLARWRVTWFNYSRTK